MRKISIPIVYGSFNYDRSVLLQNLERTGAARVMLAIGRKIKDGRIQPDSGIAGLSEEISFFESKGYEVCVWVGETIGHGWAINEKGAYSHIVSALGETAESAFCPTDDRFVKDISEWVKNVAKAGAKLILLDDDFRQSLHGTPCAASCLCEEHWNRYQKVVGENLSREEIAQKVFTGGPSKYRDAWFTLMGDTMLTFARKIRAAVDEVDDMIRIGLCSTYCIADLDGACLKGVVQILAGKNKPLLRLFGAPYWAKSGFDLANVINLERLCAKECASVGAELMSEGDTYPRPRTACPAVYLEIFDQVLAADGNMDGILKYMLDYNAPYGYETGYVERHIKNEPLIRAIEEAFLQGECVGLRWLEKFDLFRGAEFLSESINENSNWAFNRVGESNRFVSALGLPIAFEGEYPAIVFGENARDLTEQDLRYGAILDVSAAKILKTRGIDTGLCGLQKSQDVIGTEFFCEENIHVTSAQPIFYDLTVSNGAEVLTYLEGDQKHIGAYRYENANKQRFLVYSFEGNKTDKQIFEMYARQREVVRQCSWLCGKKLPASCTGNPETYMICKKTIKSLVVGFWNLFADDIPLAEIELDRKYSSIKFVLGQGDLSGEKVILKNVAPYSFVCFILEI